MSDIIKNREIVLKDSAVIQESFSGVESNVNIFWYLEKVDNNVYPYEENHVVDYILGVYSHIDNYTPEIANDFPQDKIQYFMIHEPNFKYYPDPENIQVNIMLRNIYTSEKLANNTFNKSTRFTGNYNFNKIASLNKSDYEKFNGIPAAKLQDIIDIIGDNRAISLCVDTPYFTSTDTNTLLSDTCYLYDETYQVILSLTYPNGMDVVIPVNVTSDITGSVDAAAAVTPTDISGTIDNAIEVTPIDITGEISNALKIESDITGSVDTAVGVTPVDITGSVDTAVGVTPVDITGEISNALKIESDITGNFVISKKNAYIWNDSLNNKMGIDIDGEFNIDPMVLTELRYNLTGKVGVTNKDNLQTNLNSYSYNNVPSHQTITEYPTENLNEAKMIAEYNKNVDASYAFSGCRALTSLDVSNFDTSNITNMNHIFGDCYALTTLDVSNWNTSKVTNMDGMFNYCQSLTSLDLSNFDTSNVSDMSSIFTACNSLRNLTLNFDMSSITEFNKAKYMFNNCNITTGNIRFYNVRKSIFISRSTFISCINGSGIKSSILTVEFIDDTRSLNAYSANYVSNYNTITSYPTENLNEIKGLLKINDNINASEMFNGCGSLTTLDVSNFDTSNVTEMNYVFSQCNALTTLDISNFDTSKVTNMEGMFINSINLANLTLNFDMSDITATNNVQYMFYGCTITTGNIRFFNVKRSVFTDRATFISAISGSGISDSILTIEFID